MNRKLDDESCDEEVDVGFDHLETAGEKSIQRRGLAVGVIVVGLVLVACIIVLVARKPGKKPVRDGIEAPRGKPDKPGKPSKRPKNVIMMISDGFGPAGQTFARYIKEYRDWRKANPTANSNDFMPEAGVSKGLPLDGYQVGSSRSHSASSFITDSAAGATAFSCAKKTNNSVVALTHKGDLCGSVMWGARHKRNMETGIVVTSRVTHATPAAFSAHSSERNWEDCIASQQAWEMPSVLMGGGRRHFDPAERRDKVDVLGAASSHGAKYILNNTGDLKNFEREIDSMEIKEGEKVLGLYAKSHMEFAVARNFTEQPHLGTMVNATIKYLERRVKELNKDGFMMMIEGSRIDMAGHNNDAGAYIEEILEYNQVFDDVRKWAEEQGDTVIISTSDHETGGISLGWTRNWQQYPIYAWHPERFSKAYAHGDTVEMMETHMLDILAKKHPEIVPSRPTTVGAYFKAHQTDDVTIQEVMDAMAEATHISKENKDQVMKFRKEQLMEILANHRKSKDITLASELGRIVAHTADLQWTSRGHTGVDVNLYMVLPQKWRSLSMGQIRELGLPLGNVENIEVGRALRAMVDYPPSAAQEEAQSFLDAKGQGLFHGEGCASAF